MRKLIGLVVAAGAALAIGFGGCGDNGGAGGSGGDGGSPILITISGMLDVHPVSLGINQALNGGTPNVTWGATAGDVVIYIFDPLDIIKSLQPGEPAPTPLAAIQDLTACMNGNALVPRCPLSVSNVNIANATLGIVALIKDMRGTPLFEDTNVGLFGKEEVDSLKANPSPGYPNAVFYGVTKESLDHLGGLDDASGDALKIADMRTNGVLFGTMLDSSIPIPAPVSGVTIARASHNIYYPAATLDSLTGTSTAAGTGFFMAVANTTSAQPLTWVASNTTGPVMWENVLAGTSPNAVFVLLWRADPLCDLYCKTLTARSCSLYADDATCKAACDGTGAGGAGGSTGFALDGVGTDTDTNTVQCRINQANLGDCAAAGEASTVCVN